MSKLMRQIEQLGKNEGQRIGFGFKQLISTTPSMVLIATTKEPLNKISSNNYPIDAIVFIQSSNPELNSQDPLTWDASSSTAENRLDSIAIGFEADKLNTTDINNKIDFILINDHSIELEQLDKDDLGRVLVISEKFLLDNVAGLETLPIDAILLKETLSLPITLEKLLHISTLRADCSLPFLVKLEAKPSKWELDCLSEIGIQGITLDLSSITKQEFTEISNNLKIPVKRKRQKSNTNSPLLPSASIANSDHGHDDDDGYDDD